MLAVLDVLAAMHVESGDLPTQIDIPAEVLDAFGKRCLQAELVDELGNFNDPKKLVRYFCESPAKKAKKTPAKKSKKVKS